MMMMISFIISSFFSFPFLLLLMSYSFYPLTPFSLQLLSLSYSLPSLTPFPHLLLSLSYSFPSLTPFLLLLLSLSSLYFLFHKNKSLASQFDFPYFFFFSPVSWVSRIQWLHLCRGGKTAPTRVLDMATNNQMARFQWYWSSGEYSFIAIAPRSTLAPSGSALDRVLSMGQIEPFDI